MVYRHVNRDIFMRHQNRGRQYSARQRASSPITMAHGRKLVAEQELDTTSCRPSRVDDAGSAWFSQVPSLHLDAGADDVRKAGALGCDVAGNFTAWSGADS
jgi:hypothetical protein